MVMAPLPAATSNTVPVTVWRRHRRGAEEIAAAVLDQAAEGFGPVGAVEGGQGRDGVAARGHLEHRAVIRRCAASSVVPKRLPLPSSTRAAVRGWPRWCR